MCCRAFNFTKPEGSKIIFAGYNINICQMHVRWRFAQFFELWWWRFYLSRKEKSTYLRWKRNYWTAFLDRFGVVLPSAGRILDAGCGPAGIFMVLPAERVDALDPLLDRYAAELPHFNPSDYPLVRFFQCPLEAFEPGIQYETIFCLNAINHVADLQQSLDRLTELAQPGGHMFLSVDAHRFYLLMRLFQLLPGDILHPQQFTVSQYAEMLHRRGWAILRTDCVKRAGIFDYTLFTAIRRAE